MTTSSDNAGGIAKMAHLDPRVRAITDKTYKKKYSLRVPESYLNKYKK